MPRSCPPGGRRLSGAARSDVGGRRALVARRRVRVVDLSGAFRLRDAAARAQWYPATAGDAGRRGLRLDRIRDGRDPVARGCCRTRAATQRPRCWRCCRWRAAGCSARSDIIIDAKSGISGRGQGAERTDALLVRTTAAWRRTVRSATATRPRWSRRSAGGDVRAAPGAARSRHSLDIYVPAGAGHDGRGSGGGVRAGVRLGAVRPVDRRRLCPRSSTWPGPTSAISAGRWTRHTGACSSCRAIDNLVKGAAGPGRPELQRDVRARRASGAAVKLAGLLKLGGELT